jgi:nitrate reductase gamma subunit
MSAFIAITFYIAITVFVVGIIYRISIYAKTPAPLKIPTMPAPMTRGGVVVRMLKEVTLFHSLFRSNKWIWLFGWLFHVGMLIVVLRHLRYFQEPVWWWVDMIQWIGVYAGFAMLAGLLGLWLRRIVVERIRYITGPSDHLMLALLVSIVLTGLAMKYVSHTDIVAVKSYMLGIMYFDWQPIPTDPVLYVHLLLVATLLIIFPVSKLLHAPGVFFSPSRNQADDSRRRRHLAPWAAKMEGK